MAGSLFMFGPEPDNNPHRHVKTLRQRFIRLIQKRWFRISIFGATVIYCVLQIVLSTHICDKWLRDDGGVEWEGDGGVLRTFYPLSTCSEADTLAKNQAMQIFNILFTLIITGGVSSSYSMRLLCCLCARSGCSGTCRAHTLDPHVNVAHT